MDMNNLISAARQEGYEVGKKEIEQKIINAIENGDPIEYNGRAWFIVDDMTNLRLMFQDFQNDAEEESQSSSWVIIKQKLFDIASDLMLTSKSRQDIAGDLLMVLALLTHEMEE